VEEAKNSGQKIFLIIDEYDNFANDLIGQGHDDLYHELLASEGYVRTFYKGIKDGTMDSIARVFLTGVSPIMLDDLTSGFNITANLTLKKSLNEMMGFTREEMAWLIRELDLGVEDQEALLRDIERYYDGYLFNKEAEERLYNSDMALYFLKELHEEKKYPENIIDDNVKTDYKKLYTLATNFRDEETLRLLLEDKEIATPLVSRFTLSSMFERKENFASLLYYLGMLTIKGSEENLVRLGIPNYVIKKVYWEYFLEVLERDVGVAADRLRACVRKMRREGDISDFVSYLKELLAVLSNRDLRGFNERYIKIMIMTLINVDGIYLINSEPENEAGYADIILSRDTRHIEITKYEWLIELKYLKESERHLLEKAKAEGLEQLRSYSESKRVKYGLDAETLKAVLFLIIGKKDLEVAEV